MASLHSLSESVFALKNHSLPTCPPFDLPQRTNISICRKKLVLISAHYDLRRPLLPQDKPVRQPIILENPVAVGRKVISRDVVPASKIELRYAKRPVKNFCSFIETTPEAEAVAFFREVLQVIRERRIEDFHLKIRDGFRNFRVEVFYGKQKTGPELSASEECIYCSVDAPLYPGNEPGILARECILEEFCDQPHVLCRLDTKGRSGFDITPVRHVERMSDLNDEELYALWNVAVRFLRQAELPYISMMSKHGNHRSVQHCHVRVWVDSESHKQYQMKWSEDRKRLWRQLEQLAISRPKKQEQCFFFAKNKSCWHGDLCSFSHVTER